MTNKLTPQNSPQNVAFVGKKMMLSKLYELPQTERVNMSRSTTITQIWRLTSRISLYSESWILNP